MVPFGTGNSALGCGSKEQGVGLRGVRQGLL